MLRLNRVSARLNNAHEVFPARLDVREGGIPKSMGTTETAVASTVFLVVRGAAILLLYSAERNKAAAYVSFEVCGEKHNQHNHTLAVKRVNSCTSEPTCRSIVMILPNMYTGYEPKFCLTILMLSSDR